MRFNHLQRFRAKLENDWRDVEPVCRCRAHSADGGCLVFVESAAARISDVADAHVLRIGRALELGLSAFGRF